MRPTRRVYALSSASKRAATCAGVLIGVGFVGINLVIGRLLASGGR